MFANCVIFGLNDRFSGYQFVESRPLYKIYDVTKTVSHVRHYSNISFASVLLTMEFRVMRISKPIMKSLHLGPKNVGVTQANSIRKS